MSEKTKEMDPETHFKDTFRVFSKDEEGAFCALPTEASMSWKQHVQSKLIIFLLFSGYTSVMIIPFKEGVCMCLVAVSRPALKSKSLWTDSIQCSEYQMTRYRTAIQLVVGIINFSFQTSHYCYLILSDCLRLCRLHSR